MTTWDAKTTAIGTAVAAVAAVAAAVGAIATVLVAYYGLQDTARQLQATTIYNVAKDGKALQKRYLAKDADPDEVMSYFYSAYRLYSSHVLDDAAWYPIQNALCRFSKDTTIRDIPQWWVGHKQLYDGDFRTLVDTLEGKTSCES
jgi:hypothetical protein